MNINQKGLAPIFILVILAITVLGGYLIYQKQVNQFSPFQLIQSQFSPNRNINPYVNTTLGFTLKLPKGWIVCEGGYINGSVSVGPIPKYALGYPNSNCSQWKGKYVLFIAKMHDVREALFAALDPPEVRKPGESFINYVKRLYKSYSSELTIIDSRTIFVKNTFTNREMGLVTEYTLYVENPQVYFFTVKLPIGLPNEYSDDASNLSYFQIIASSFSNSPISTGDIQGQMRVRKIENNIDSNIRMLPDYPVTLYTEDKSTIIATTKTDRGGSYNFRIKPGTYYINDPGNGWQSIKVSPGDIQTFDGGTIDRVPLNQDKILQLPLKYLDRLN